MLFICYPKCSTCIKARNYLISKDISFSERDIKLSNPTKDELDKFIKLSKKPIEKFFNTSGLVYKELGLSSKMSTLSYDEKLSLLASNGMLIKRPLLVSDRFVLIGFKEIEWESVLNI